MIKRLVPALLLALSVSAGVHAGTPTTMNYQGLLTDGGAPVVNGTYSVVFTIYNAPALGTSKWTETRNVTTSAGLFTVVLGTVTPIEDTVFNGSGRWLGIAVEGDPEMTPRTPLSTVPYAARIATVDGASGGTITGATEVTGNDGGNQLSVTNTGLGRGGFFQIANGANTEPAVQGTHVGSGPGGSFFSDGGGPGIVATATGGTAADMQGDVLVDGVLEVNNGIDSVIDLDGTINILRNWGADGNGENWRLWGGSFGQMFLHASDVANTRMVEVSAPANGGEIELHNAAGADYIKLDGGETGDNSAQLAVDAVNAGEMLDEPGLASNSSLSDVLGAPSTVALRSITCPAAGYVLATGSGYVEVGHINGSFSDAEMWLSDSTGSALGEFSSLYRISGFAPSGSYTTPYSVQEVYTVGAGLKTIYLRGSANTAAIAHDNVLTLVYLPTAYGTVAASELANQGEASSETELDVVSEQVEAKRFALERMTREIALQQAKLAKLAEQVEELQAATSAPAVE